MHVLCLVPPSLSCAFIRYLAPAPPGVTLQTCSKTPVGPQLRRNENFKNASNCILEKSLQSCCQPQFNAPAAGGGSAAWDHSPQPSLSQGEVKLQQNRTCWSPMLPPSSRPCWAQSCFDHVYTCTAESAALQ